VRLVNILAKLYLVLSLAGAVPPAYAFERGVDGRDSSPAQEATGLQAFRSSGLPAETLPKEKVGGERGMNPL
jgi:hypothetical protein